MPSWEKLIGAVVTMCVCVCFLTIYYGSSSLDVLAGGSHRSKVTQDFSATFLRCVP